MAFVEIENVTKSFVAQDRVAALHDFSASVVAGEMIAILGPSGCGKSTLLRCVAGLERPDSGTIRIDGVTVSNDRTWIPPERRGIGMVFQSYALWPHMTVAENVGFPLKIARTPRVELNARVEAALSVVGLAAVGTRMPSQLSGGQQQRVALARATVAHPKLMLFDEPLSNLDAKLRESMRVELREIQQRLGWTALYVTHDRIEAMTMADRVVVLRDGVIQQVDTATDLYHRPVNSFVAEFLGDVTYVPERLVPPHAVPPNGGSRVGLRPEALRATPFEGGDVPAGAWIGRVRSSMDLGWHLECVVDVEGTAMRARGAAGAPLPVGSQALVWPDFGNALLLRD